MTRARHAFRFQTEPLEQRRLLSTYVPPTSPRQTLDLDDGWRFVRSDVAGASASNFDDSGWTPLALPHTWNATDGQDGGSNYYRGVGWYRRPLVVPPSMAGNSLYLGFEGASVSATIYLDGNLIGTHVGAFSAFNFDVTAALASAGTHSLAIKVDNSASLNQIAGPQSGDFTTFGGLYRDVKLTALSPVRVAADDLASSGVYFSASNVSSASANLSVRTNLHNASAAPQSVVVHTVVTDVDQTIVAESSTFQSVGSASHLNVTQTATLPNPHLWNGRLDPYLHNLYVEVRDATSGALLDLVQDRVGIRSYSISPSLGFILNGQPYALHGASLHQDRLGKGWAIADADVDQDLNLMMEVGATALRTAHYQQSERLYERADELGLLVYTEVPNVGSGNGGVIPTTTDFANTIQQQLKETIRQNFNHPSIVLWGVYNEVSDNTANRAFVSTLNTLARSEDPSRLTVGASWNGSVGSLERITNVVAYNRYYGWYYGAPSGLATQLDAMHAAAPTVPIGMSEYGAGAALTQHQQNPPLPPTAGPWHPEEYQALYHEQSWRILAARPWVWSAFVWNMFDFAVDGRNEGDTPGRNDKGLVSFDRQTRKDAFYFYKANWSSDPFVYLTSRRWTERSSATTEVKVYANVSNVRLSVNGVDVGAMTNTGAGVWVVPIVTLQPGDNTVTVSGTRDGQAYTDTVVWHLTPPPAPMAASEIQINFQPTDAGPNAVGYAIDSGSPYGVRPNGASYGWSGDNSANTRRRNVNSDPRYDTLIHLQYNGSRFTWEHAVPNGIYDVFLAAGDPSYTDSLQRFLVEGVPALDGDGQDNLDTFQVRVLVTDGQLTVEPSGINTKLNFLQIKTIDATAPIIVSSSFEFETRHAVKVYFSEAIDLATLDAGDLTVQPVGGGDSFTPAAVEYDPTAHAATFSFASALPDNIYTARLAAGSVADVAGLSLAGPYTSQTFFVLAGDLNRDHAVDFADLLTLAQSYGQTSRTFSQGNVDYSTDGLVGFDDLLILAQRYGTSLATFASRKQPRQRVSETLFAD